MIILSNLEDFPSGCSFLAARTRFNRVVERRVEVEYVIATSLIGDSKYQSLHFQSCNLINVSPHLSNIFC
jgi:hypothetical protein